MRMKRKDYYLLISVILAAVIIVIVLAVVMNKDKSSEKSPSVTVESTENIDVQESAKTGNENDSQGSSSSAGSPTEEVIDEAEQFANDPTHLFYDANSQSGYLNHCIFLGDSRTVAAKDYSYLNDADALCQVGINHLSFMTNVFLMYSGEEINMETFLRRKTADVIYISLGVNGINTIDDASYKSGYKKLVNRVKELAPNSVIVIEAIWPVEDDGLYAYAVQNSEIDRYNEFLHELATEEGCFYLNIDSVLKDSDGTMVDKYDGGDGLHYSKTAYSTIFDYIIHHPVPGIDTTGEYVVNYIAPKKRDIDPADGFTNADGENSEDTDDTAGSSSSSGENADDGPAPGEDLGMDLVSRIHAYGVPSGALDDGTELFLYDNKLYTSTGALYLDIATSTFGPGFEYLADENYSSDDSGDVEYEEEYEEYYEE